MDQAYVETMRLLLETAPEVFRPACFAMKGGTALNLFVQDMPRLSVDIDVVYVSHTTARAAALAEIRAELNAVERQLRALGLDAQVTASKAGDETKVFVARKGRQIKIEVNHVFRGTVLPTERRKLVKAAGDLFTTALTVPTLAVAELYGSKLVAPWTGSIQGISSMFTACIAKSAWRPRSSNASSVTKNTDCRN